MRQLLCEGCGERQKLKTGQRMALERTGICPAEFERVAWGRALPPTTEQRTMYVNDTPHPMTMGEYTSDLCSAAILPGARCCAWTMWLEGEEPDVRWEHEFLTGPR